MTALPARIADMTLTELGQGLATKQISSREIVEAYLTRIARADEKLNAYVALYADEALKLAVAADQARAAGLPQGPLAGLPIGLKDLIEIEGRVTTAGSKARKDRLSATTATVVERLLASGMIPLGKTHTVEFAFGGWGTNTTMGTPRNPWDLATHRVPGGSSSGSGVAVASGLAPAALGTDTGGSVRIPAAVNGLIGLKTTVGRVSTHGIVPLSPTLDSVGPMTRSIADAALLLDVLAGPDPRDRLTLAAPIERFAPPRVDDIHGRRIVVADTRDLPPDLHPAVGAAFATAASTFEELGAFVEERRLPEGWGTFLAKTGTIMSVEAYAAHRKLIDDPAQPIGAPIRTRIQGGRSIIAADYAEILWERDSACRRILAWLGPHDALLLPTVPCPAVPVAAVDEAQPLLSTLTRAANYLGFCALNLPAGFSDEGLPVGVQLLARPFAESLLLELGEAFTAATDWHRRRPDLSSLGL